MATRAADDFDTIRKRLEQIKKEQDSEAPTNDAIKTSNNTDAKATVTGNSEPSSSSEYGLCYQAPLVDWANGLNYGWSQPFYRIGDIEYSSIYDHNFILCLDGIYPCITSGNSYLPVLYEHYKPHNIDVED